VGCRSDSGPRRDDTAVVDELVFRRLSERTGTVSGSSLGHRRERQQRLEPERDQPQSRVSSVLVETLPLVQESGSADMVCDFDLYRRHER